MFCQLDTQAGRSAKKYATLKYSLAIIDTAYLLTLLFIFVGSGFSKILAREISGRITVGYLVVPVYLLVAYVIYYILDFPLNLYHSFLLEHKFRLSQQKISDWLKDQVKGGIISYIFSLILLEVFYYILAHYPDIWWLLVSICWIFFSIILAKIIPVVIIPLFFKYKKFSDEILKQRIINLAQKMKINPVRNTKDLKKKNKISNGVKILDVFEIDLSRKTQKANAAFVGIGRTKRVILADTLRDKYSPDEIEVILAHEFAHYRLKHLLKLMMINSLVAILSFYIIFRTSDYFLHRFGFSSLSDISSLPLILIYFVILGIITKPLENYVSRRLERNADRLALSVTGLKDAFILMMDKLSKQNLADRNPHPLIKFFFFDHPPVDERISMAAALTIEKR